jgi:endonuclease YncB( thermonuclease family)
MTMEDYDGSTDAGSSGTVSNQHANSASAASSIADEHAAERKVALSRPAYRYQADVLDVHDGDTQTYALDLGFGTGMRKIKVRLLGWDCPELKEKLGLTARDAAATLLRQAKSVIVETVKDEQTFNRWLAHVYVDGQDLGELLAAKGLATKR